MMMDRRIADELLGSGKYAPGYERAHFPGCDHGFAVRGDLVSACFASIALRAEGMMSEQARSEGGQGGRVQERRRVFSQAPVMIATRPCLAPPWYILCNDVMTIFLQQLLRL
jgi:hypothetical protein